MFTNNTSKADAMSTQTSQAAPLDIPNLNNSHKRRRSQELPHSERFISRQSADLSNGQCSPVSKRDEKRCLSVTKEDGQESRGHGDKRQRTAGAFNPTHGNGVHCPFNQQEVRKQPAQTMELSSVRPVLPKEDRPRVGIATLPPVLFGVTSLRPKAFRSFKPGEHLAPIQSPPVSQDPIAQIPPPFALYESLGGGFDSLAAGKEGFNQTFVDTKEELFGLPAVETTKQAPLTQGPHRRKAFEVWKDVSQSSNLKDCKYTAPGPLRDVTNIREHDVASRRVRSTTGQEPAVVVKKPLKKMRVEAGEHDHPNLKDFKFPQGAAACEKAVEEVAESEENASAAEAPQQSQFVEESPHESARPSKRKADDDLRERTLEKLKPLGDQPLPSVGDHDSQSMPVQDFASKCFAEYAKSLPSNNLVDMIHTVVHEGSSGLTEAQHAPVVESQRIRNDESPSPVNDSSIQLKPSQELVPEHDESVSSFVRLASPDLKVLVNELSRDQKSSAGDEAAFWEFNTRRKMPPATETITTHGMVSIIIPTVPSWVVESSRYAIAMNMAYSEGYNPEHPRDYERYIARFTARPAVSRPREYEYRPMPEMLDVEMLNQRLNWVVPGVGRAPRLFRELPVPPPHIDSELTRCVRFAQSDSQKRVDWRAHPNHVAEIIQRTNFYGMELLIGRAYMRISSPPTKDEFELAMATRLAHASFGKDPVAYIAADLPALSEYLVENPPSAMYLIPNEEKDHFSDFTKYYRLELAEKYPPLSAVGLPTWQLLLDGERGRPSLKAQGLQYIIDSIKEQTALASGDGRCLQSLDDRLSYEDAELRNENLTSYSPDPDLNHSLDGGNLDGDFGWNISEFNVDFLNVDCVPAWEEINTNPAFHLNSEEVTRSYPDPVNPGAGGEALDPIADFYSQDEFWANQNLSTPWDFGPDDSAPGFDVILPEAPAAGSVCGQKTGIPFDSDAETDEWL